MAEIVDGAAEGLGVATTFYTLYNERPEYKRDEVWTRDYTGNRRFVDPDSKPKPKPHLYLTREAAFEASIRAAMGAVRWHLHSRCLRGTLGASLMMPSYIDRVVGFAVFPVGRLSDKVTTP